MKSQEVNGICRKAFDELVDAVASGKSQAMLEYLSVMGKFSSYSFGNVMLIYSQMPKATRIAGFRTWSKLGRYVRKGEHGIAIMAPVVYHRRELPDGECEEEDSELIRGFRAVYVFDVSQTDGKSLPEFAKVRGQPHDCLPRLQEYVSKQGIVLEYADNLFGAEGLSSKGRIRLKRGLAPAEEFSVLCHELAHEKLHHDPEAQKLDKKTVETEAEAVAYIVSHAAGLDVNSSASDYIQLYKGDKDALISSMKRIHETASEIMASIIEEPVEAVLNGGEALEAKAAG